MDISIEKEQTDTDSLNLAATISMHLYLIAGVLGCCLLLAPSFAFVLVYLPVFAGTSIWVILEQESISEEDHIELIALTLLIGAIGSLGLFYILQKRELERFLQQQEIVKREQKISRKE